MTDNDSSFRDILAALLGKRAGFAQHAKINIYSVTE